MRMWILNDPTRYQDFVRPRGSDDADEQISWICVRSPGLKSWVPGSGFGFRRTGCVYQRSGISTTLMKFSSLKAWSRPHRRIVIRQGGIAGPPRRRRSPGLKSWVPGSGFGFRRTGWVYQRSGISSTLMKFSSLKAWSRPHRRIVIRQGGIAGPPRRRHSPGLKSWVPGSGSDGRVAYISVPASAPP